MTTRGRQRPRVPRTMELYTRSDLAEGRPSAEDNAGSLMANCLVVALWDRQVVPVQVVLVHQADELRGVGWIGGVAGRIDAASELPRVAGGMERRGVARVVA